MQRSNNTIPELLGRYLLEEQNKDKAELRDILEERIENYLSQAPHHRKFTFLETYQILYHNADHTQNFTAHGAAQAYNAIIQYAQNRLAQPWRKEFHTIRMFSGYYKHNVDVNLKEASLLLEKLGYTKCEHSLVIQPPMDSAPIDPDAIMDVAQDALFAYVECKMIQTMWEKLRERGASYSWVQLLNYRKQNICSVGPAVSALLAAHRHQMHQPMHCQDHYDTRHLGLGQQPVYGQTRPYGMDFYGMQRYNPYVPQMMHVPVPYCSVAPNLYQVPTAINVPTAQLIEVEGAPMAMAPAMTMPMIHQPSPLVGPIYGQAPPLQQVGSPVTGTQPIRPMPSPVSAPRLDNGFVNSKSATYATVDKTRNWDTHRSQSVPQNQVAQPPPEPQSDSSTGVDNWDYVYRNLENQGYSKDVGERGDLLQNAASCDVNVASGTTGLRLPSTSDGERGLSGVMQRIQLDDRESSEVDCRASLYDNVPSPSNAKSPVEDPKDGTFWVCTYCTLHNDIQRTVCEACAHSREAGPEGEPLASGGPQCPDCTLVNKKDASKCEACGKELEGSPTYV